MRKPPDFVPFTVAHFTTDLTAFGLRESDRSAVSKSSLPFPNTMQLFYFIFWTIFLYVLSDPCGDEWIFVTRLHSCYLAPHQPLPWHEAEHHCLTEGGHLVSVNSAEESQFVRALANQHNPQFLTWIGLNRRANLNYTHQPWLWSNGDPVDFTNFQIGEPSEWGDCVALSSSMESSGWITIDCEYSQFFLCEKSADGIPPVVMTTDTGEFYSPGYPGNYPDHSLAYYFIELPPHQRVLITVEYIVSEKHRDILQIFDGTFEGSPILARLSGIHHNNSFLSQSNTIMVLFSSDGGGSGAGFKARYSSWSVPPLERLQGEGSVIESSNFPDFAPPFTLQRFLILCSSDQHVHFNITDFHIATEDQLSFYDGSVSRQHVLRIFNVNSNVPTQFFRSIENVVHVVFEAKDSYDLSRWRFRYDCVRKDGIGDEIIIP
ncbi:lectin C-type domain protein [Necator americanus]|uniref:Lectin C-type domain protein n=1 Tax=Necator americanus TaxID=51031 RepID=W2T8T0_NECAM|nr:lectin C-type domain protein [Necator americanus]ETN77611.1 lectin C-type domain protein [Necator americanus]